MAMLGERSTASLAAVTEKNLRRQIDLSVSRALVDGEYARRLLTDPTVAVEDCGCPPQHFKLLRSIHATDLFDFARQAQALFWRVNSDATYLEELPLAASR